MVIMIFLIVLHKNVARTIISVYFSFIFIFSGLFLSVISSADELPWPIDSPKYISSTFGEFRPGRFHFGLDFKSGGVTGKKVFALGDGYISLVRTTPFGYGKVLYLTLDSGETVVYGHLSGFLPEIEDRLFTTRINKKSYDVELYFRSNEFRVERGQVIAYSGDTGSGPAHLHLELRDKHNVPLNPLNHGIIVKDTISPIIESALLLPLDSTSSIDGIPDARLFDFTSSNDDPIILSGKIGVAVSTLDRVDMTSNRLGVYRITLAVDSTVVFSKSYDRISYDAANFGAFDYPSTRYHSGQGYLTALFRQTGNELDFYEGAGMLTDNALSPNKPHILTIRVLDHENNAVERSLPVIFGSRPFFTVCEFIDRERIHVAGRDISDSLERVEIYKLGNDRQWLIEQTVSVEGSEFDITVNLQPTDAETYKIVIMGGNGLYSLPAVLRIDSRQSEQNLPVLRIFSDLRHDHIMVRIESSDLLASLPVLHIEQENGIPGGYICPVPTGETTWVSSLGFPQTGKQHIGMRTTAYSRTLEPIEETAHLEFTACGIKPVTVHAPDSLFFLSVDPRALYRPAPVVVDTVQAKSSNGLIPVSGSYRVRWGYSPLKGSCDVALELDRDPPDKAALYSSGNGNGWRFISGEHKGRIFTGKLGGSGYVAVLVDRLAPYVAPESPRPGSSTASRKPLIRARIEDKGSGIAGSDSIAMSIDGITIYGEYDYEADRVSYTPHNPLSTGTHVVNVTVTDRAGNSQTRSWKFTVRDQ